jgi:ribosomal protein S18 acetylase RimI-like enzyme
VKLTKTDEAHLDNAVWSALRHRQARFAAAATTERVVCFDPEVSIFSGVDRLDERGWAALADAVGEGGSAVLFRDLVPEPPAGWQETYRDEGLQLVAEDLVPPPDLEVDELGRDDAAEMLTLAQLTEPGPFCPRTYELGTYMGIRRDGRLVAMAGQRFRLPGWTEVSAVCTHPAARQLGFGAGLTLLMAAKIREDGDEAFLHVLASNENALRLYQTLGFRVRRKVDVVVVQWGEQPDEGQ